MFDQATWDFTPCGDFVPDLVCWSRMQAEAGQEVHSIVARKELERLAGDGLFFWGIGNAPGRLARALARKEQKVELVLSMMKSRPKLADSVPDHLLVWRRYIDAHGAERPLPHHVLITSRAETARGAKRAHYALMCRSEKPLAIRDHGPFDPSAYRNASGTHAPVGASQVTAILRRVAPETSSSSYRVNMRGELTGSYWVRLSDPLLLTEDKRAEMGHWLSRNICPTIADWIGLVAELRDGEQSCINTVEEQVRLL